MDLKAQIRTIWEEVLEKNDFSNSDCIMDIGGNSMSIYKICAKAKEKLDINISPMDLFMYPSINDIVNHLSKNENFSQIQPVSECRVIKRRTRRKE